MKPWKLAHLKRIMTRWQKGLEGRAWNSNYLSNHDQPRMVTVTAEAGQPYLLQHFRATSAYYFDAGGDHYVASVHSGSPLDKSFIDQREAYKKIFTRCGLKFLIVEASSGSMGGALPMGCLYPAHGLAQVTGSVSRD